MLRPGSRAVALVAWTSLDRDSRWKSDTACLPSVSPYHAAARVSSKMPAAIARRAHAAGAHWMEHAGDVLADVLGKRRVILDQGGEFDAPVSQCREDRPRERRYEVEDRGERRACNPARRSDAIEAPQAIVELHWKGDAAHRPHALVRQNLDCQAEALHEALEVELVASEVEFDAGRRGIARREPDPAARHRLEQGGRQIGNLKAECAP